jgi:hypothetical protein
VEIPMNECGNFTKFSLILKLGKLHLSENNYSRKIDTCMKNVSHLNSEFVVFEKSVRAKSICG